MLPAIAAALTQLETFFSKLPKKKIPRNKKTNVNIVIKELLTPIPIIAPVILTENIFAKDKIIERNTKINPNIFILFICLTKANTILKVFVKSIIIVFKNKFYFILKNGQLFIT